ncbi:ArnT family glycosyltransferase [Lignipirellula cremea]|uniref:Undecaprenyl phosphate-alpha-4-amino-4-deoxy-L-arabinose arabinosyl transferase n=1 Tax=Lignipirellula cremea TaxID=2528010 RepID=A0A518DYX1_9BACT|nr:glycosyltransferase family 39 protein [Lignipirellula cremea]QDU97039.1 Undecaprenyl phosphate-alpha-4-amino-4-deoxy-L-arabinose arabinosyl transferase [Lignipirellula cremea]
MKSMPWGFAVVMLTAAVVLFTNLGGPRLWDQDEPRNAGCAREMLERGDWVTPMFNAELRTAKPVLTYWLMMSAYAVFGQGEFAARFWSAALCWGTVGLTYLIALRLFNAQAAFWAGLILATTLMLNVAGHAATPDAPLIFFSTLALAAFVMTAWKPRVRDALGDLEPAEMRHPAEGFPASWWAALMIYGAMGLAVLAKGPVGLVLPTAIIGMFLLIVRLPQSAAKEEEKASSAAPVAGWRIGLAACLLIGVALGLEALAGMKAVVAVGSLLVLGLAVAGQTQRLAWLRPFAPLHFLKTCAAMRPATALLTVLVIAAPWFIWVGLRTNGEFLEKFFFDENIGRATSAMEGHEGPFLYYPIVILAGFFPWSVFAAPLLIDLVRRLQANEDPWRRGYLLAVCWVGVFVGAFSLAATKLPSYVTPCYPGLALLAGCYVYRLSQGLATDLAWRRVALGSLTAVGAIFLLGGTVAFGQFMPGSQWMALFGLVPLLAGIGAIVCFERGLPRLGAGALALAAPLLVLLVFSLGLPEVDRHRSPQQLVDMARSRQGQFMAYGTLEPSWVYYTGHPIPHFDAGKLDEAIERMRASEDPVVIMHQADYERVRKQLPADAVVIAEANRFLKEEKLVLVARDLPAVETARLKKRDER